MNKITEQEAIKALKFDMEMILFDPQQCKQRTPEEVKAINDTNYMCYLADEMAIKALEKQIAKKPIQQSTDEKTHYKCVCGHLMLTRYHADGLLVGSHTFHCSKCGQKLDWE